MHRADMGFSSRVLAALGLTVLVGLLVLIAFIAIDVWLLSFLSLLLALGLRDTAAWLGRKTGLPLSAALVAVITVLLALTWALVALAAPSISDQANELASTLPKALQDVEQRLRRAPWGPQVLDQIPSAEEVLPRARALLGRAPGVFSATFGVLANLVIVITLVLFIAFQFDLYRAGVLRLVPPRQRERAGDVLDDLSRTLSLWLIGRIIAMLVITVMSVIGLWILGVPLALVLALIAGFLNFIPNIGPIAAAVPAGLLALLQGPSTLLWVIALYTFIQVVESYLLTPYIQQKAIDMPPAILIVTQVVMGVLLGFLGLLLATPLTAAVIVLVRRLYVEDFLEEPGAVDAPASR